MSGILHWGKKEYLGTTFDPYADIETYEVPVTGEVDIDKISEVMRKKYPQQAYKFVGATDNGDGTVNIKLSSWVGD